MFRFSPETAEDEAEVEYLLDLCFAPGRTALSSYRLRDGVPKVADFSLVARDDYSGIAGSIRYWPVEIGPTGATALLLGPVAVHPTHQGEGLGAMLILESLDMARQSGWERVILVGDAPYYGRFGFQRAAHLKFPPPTNPDRVLALEFVEGGFDGVKGTVRKFGTAKALKSARPIRKALTS